MSTSPGSRGPRTLRGRCCSTLREWIDAGVMSYDDTPTFTIYRMRFTDASGTARDIAGVLGGLEVVDEGAGGVLPHERVTPKASTDRLDLTRATQANLSPVWGLSLASGLTALLAEPGDPIASVTVDGVDHVVERVSDPARVQAIADKVGSDDVLIADGHHRYGISRTYRDEVRATIGGRPNPADDTLVFVNELVADQLSVEAIHRMYHDVSFDDLVAALDRSFDAAAAGGTGRPDACRDVPRWRVVSGGPRRRCSVADSATRGVRRRALARRRLAGARARRPRRTVSPTSRCRSRRRRGDIAWRCHRQRVDPSGQRGRDRTDRSRGRADAAEVDVLHPEAPHRHGGAQPRLKPPAHAAVSGRGRPPDRPRTRCNGCRPACVGAGGDRPYRQRFRCDSASPAHAEEAAPAPCRSLPRRPPRPGDPVAPGSDRPGDRHRDHCGLSDRTRPRVAAHRMDDARLPEASPRSLGPREPLPGRPRVAERHRVSSSFMVSPSGDDSAGGVGHRSTLEMAGHRVPSSGHVASIPDISPTSSDTTPLRWGIASTGSIAAQHARPCARSPMRESSPSARASQASADAFRAALRHRRGPRHLRGTLCRRRRRHRLHRLPAQPSPRDDHRRPRRRQAVLCEKASPSTPPRRGRCSRPPAGPIAS